MHGDRGGCESSVERVASWGEIGKCMEGEAR